MAKKLQSIFILLALTVIIFTVYICVTLPKMHKPLSLQTIEYALKFNTDGSVTTTKTVTEMIKGE